MTAITTTTTTTTTASDDLEARILAAVTGDDADLELVAHAIAGSDRAQAYLVTLASTLGTIAGDRDSAAAARAQALLEHGLAIAAEHAERGETAEATASAAHAHGAKPT